MFVGLSEMLEDSTSEAEFFPAAVGAFPWEREMPERLLFPGYGQESRAVKPC